MNVTIKVYDIPASNEDLVDLLNKKAKVTEHNWALVHLYDKFNPRNELFPFTPMATFEGEPK